MPPSSLDSRRITLGFTLIEDIELNMRHGPCTYDTSCISSQLMGSIFFWKNKTKIDGFKYIKIELSAHYYLVVQFMVRCIFVLQNTSDEQHYTWWILLFQYITSSWYSRFWVKYFVFCWIKMFLLELDVIPCHKAHKHLCLTSRDKAKDIAFNS